ncbi:MAG: hypothetical protein L3V56_02830 [Candidatus Magnetoovum sp. WYHC-5]|nr:hypothetical protein [Candidatus Magnetoovum sp. WYHC-5]
MEKTFRYKMEHIGDIFINMIEKTTQAARNSAKGVVLTHDIHDSRRQRKRVIKKLGAKVIELKKEGKSLDLTQNQEVMDILNTIESLESKEIDLLRKRQEKVYVKTGSWFSRCKCKDKDKKTEPFIIDVQEDVTANNKSELVQVGEFVEEIITPAFEEKTPVEEEQEEVSLLTDSTEETANSDVAIAEDSETNVAKEEGSQNEVVEVSTDESYNQDDNKAQM